MGRATADFRIIELAEIPVGLVLVPFTGPSVCAGFPSPGDDFIESELELPRWLAPNPPATFLWRMAGWSVVGAGIHDGDVVIVDRSLQPVGGDVVLAIIDGVASLKRFRLDGNRAVLAFDSPDLPATPIEDIADATICGVVITALRLLRPLARTPR